MNNSNKHIIQLNRTIRSFFKISIILTCILMFIPTNKLLAQVISNNGAGISITNGTFVNTDSVQNTAGTLTNNGTFNLSGTYINADSTKGDGLFNIEGNWINTGKFISALSTVHFNGNSIQTITSTNGETFYNLIINNTGANDAINRIILLNNVNISNTLTMDSGIVETGLDTLYLINQLPTSLNYTSTTGSRVIGKFERGINVTDNYLFPVGSDANYNPMNLNFTTINNAGSILSEFVASDPDSIGLPLADPGYVNSADSVEVYNADSVGYWSVSANNLFESNNFDVNIGGIGFSTVQNASRIIKRLDGDDWILDGNHKDGADSIAYRNTLIGGIDNSPGHHFGWGHIRPRIQAQPADTAICDGESTTFSVAATGRGELNYEWEVLERIGGWQLITDNTIYANYDTDTLLIITADTSMSGYKYRVIITDSLGNFKRSNSQATLTVNPRPVVTATPQQDTICNGGITHIVFKSTVPGTTYEIEILNPNSINGDNIILDGDTIKDVLTNPTNYVDSVIYRIFPTGPDYPYCGGTADTVTIFVNPTPVMSVFVADTILCDSSTLNITVNDDLLKVKGTKVYQLTTTDAGGNVQGVQPSGEYDAGFDISDNLVNNTNQVQVISYTFRPRIDDDRNGGIPFCDDGRDTTLTIYVNPTPEFNVAVSDTIICDSSIITFDVSDLLGNVEGTKVYDLTTSYNVGAVLNVEPNTNNIPIATDIVNQLINTTNQLQTVTYNFRYRFNDPRNSNNPFCDHGIDTSITIYVNPTPKFNVSVADTIICDSSIVSLNVTDLLGNVEGTKVYDLTTTYNAGAVLNVEANANNIQIDTDIVNQLINTTNQVQAVSYNFKYRFNDPRNSNNPFCDHGIDTTITIYVNPTPRFTISIADTIVCDSTTITLDVVDGLNAVLADKVYDLSTVQSGGITGMQANGQYNIPDNVIDQLVNTTNEAQWITYTLRYRLNDTRNGGIPFCDHGIDTTITIWVNPTPQVYISVVADTICNDTYTEIKLTTPSILTSGFITFDYDFIADVGLTGSSSGNGLIHNDIIADSLHNISTAPMPTPLVVRYNITPRALSIGCADGPTRTDSITVHPTAFTNMIADSVVCYLESNGRAIVEAENGVNEFTYNWDDPFNHQTAATDSVLPIGQYIVTVTDNQSCIKIDTVLIEQPNRLIPDIDTVRNVSCFGNGDAYIILNPTGGNSGYSYSWSNGELTDSIGGLNGGYFYATVSDWKGCAQDTIMEVDEPPQVSMDISEHHVTCNGANDGWARVQVIGLNIYEWSNGATTDIITDLSPGLYIVTASNIEGCKSIESIIIKEPEVLEIDTIYSTRISCAGDDDGTLELVTIGGNIIDFYTDDPLEYTYNWTTPDGSGLATDEGDQTGLSAGTYYITVSDDQGCNANDSTAVQGPLSFESNTVSTDVTCFEDKDGVIDLSVSGGNIESDYTYYWETSNGDGLDTISEDQTNLSGGDYYVTITDANNCELLDSAIIVEPDLLETFITETNISCFGYEDGIVKIDILGGNNGYVIAWSGNPTGQSTDSIYGLSAGIYNVTVNDMKNCLTTNSVEITQPEQIETNTSSSNITCFGYSDGAISLSPTGGTIPYNYIWSHNAGLDTNIASNLWPGNYNIDILDANNCIEVSTVDITQPDRLEFDPSTYSEDITCYGEDNGYIFLNIGGGTPDYNYTWSTGASGTTIDITSEDLLTAGMYHIDVSDLQNCQIDTTIEIIEPEKLIMTPVLRKPTCTDISDGSIELNITGGRTQNNKYNVYWDNGSAEENLYDIRSGIYKVQIIDSSFCVIDTTFRLHSAFAFCIDIPSAFSPNGDNINEKWEIDMSLYPNAEIEIFDRFGKRIFFSKGYEESQYWDGSLNGKKLPMDAYYYIIYLKNGSGRISGSVTLLR